MKRLFVVFVAGFCFALSTPSYAQTPEINTQKMIILQLGQQGAPPLQIIAEQNKLNEMIRAYNATHAAGNTGAGHAAPPASAPPSPHPTASEPVPPTGQPGHHGHGQHKHHPGG